MSVETSLFVTRTLDGPFVIGADEVHLWAVDLDCREAVESGLAAALEPAEERRAARLRFPQHRRRFRVGRGFLRRLLGGYLGQPPDRIRFQTGRRGKPFLAPPLDATGLCFNLSNSAEHALVAVARGARLGVDLECLRPLSSATAIATRFFSASEQAELAALPEAERNLGFFKGWTRKEAFLKALGDGLAMPLSSFSVTLGPTQAARLISVDPRARAGEVWSLQSLRPAEGYVGALAIEGSPRRTEAWTVLLR